MKISPTIALIIALLPCAAIAQPRVVERADAQVEHAARTPDRFAFTTTEGTRLHLSIEPNARLEGEFALYADSVREGRDRYFRGSVDGTDGSWARLARIDGAWIGAVHDGTTVWLLDPARWHAQPLRDTGADTGADAGGTVAFDIGDVQLPHGFDHGDAGAGDLSYAAIVPRLDPADPRIAQAVSGDAGRGIRAFLRVTLVLDREFQARYGGNSAAVAGAVLNIADGFYRNQVGIDLSLLHLQPLATNGALTSTNPNQLLEAFVAYLNTGAVPRGGVSHLLSGKDFDGSTVGLAYVGTACRPDGFASGIDQITYSQAFGGATLAHEIGHNLNARHDSEGNSCPPSGFIMAALININNPATQFSSCSLAYFNDFLSPLPACMAAPPDRIFRNGFER
jgi:hypothetical protein